MIARSRNAEIRQSGRRAGSAGVLVPLSMKHVGADPASASGIFLTTVTDAASVGLLLGLGTVLLL